MATIVGTEVGDNLLDLGDDGTGNDQIYALGGNDIVKMAVDRDLDFVDGGDGFDIISYEFYNYDLSYSEWHGAVIDLAAGTATPSGFGLADTFINIEGAIGTYFDDTLRGDGADNWLDGSDGSDAIY